METLYGRTEQLAAARSQLERALSGHGKLLLFTGEPGIGKSRFMEQLARDAAERGAVVAWGRCWEAGGAPALTPEGNVRFEVSPEGQLEPVRIARPGQIFMNAGFGALTYAGQIGIAPAFNASVELPRYRFRFYRDGTRSEAVVDLPPVPVTASGDPHDLRPARDERGAPIVGPNLIPQQFTTDPGRAAITGDPADFEAFDVPQLRGIAKTAPYYHDNSLETLRAVIDEYSRFLLVFLKPLELPAFPPEQPGGRKEALSPEQKNDLVEFLELL